MRGGEVKEMEDSTCAMMAPGCEEQARMLACSEKGIHSPQEAPQSIGSLPRGLRDARVHMRPGSHTRREYVARRPRHLEDATLGKPAHLWLWPPIPGRARPEGSSFEHQAGSRAETDARRSQGSVAAPNFRASGGRNGENKGIRGACADAPNLGRVPPAPSSPISRFCHYSLSLYYHGQDKNL
eukprot:scaffold310035_cov27-Tisochrysis_lutea.AAC.1